MVEFRDLAAETLVWRRESGWFYPKYVLSHGDSEIGTLEFKKGWRTPARLTVGGTVWHLQGRGFWQHIHVTDEAGDEVGVFKRGFLSIGTLEMADGGSIESSGPRLFSRRVTFTDRGGSPLLALQPRGLGKRCEAELTPSGAAYPHAGLLLGIGWYAIVLRQRRAAAGS